MPFMEIFTDIFYEQERLIDYCDMIADALIRYNKKVGGSKQAVLPSDDRVRNQVHELFRDKYEALNNSIESEND